MIEKFKILYYSPHPTLNMAKPTGSGRHMREIIKAFSELGHEVNPVIMGGTEWHFEQSETDSDSFFKNKLKGTVPDIFWESVKDVKLLYQDKYSARALLEKAILEDPPDLIYERNNYLQDSGVSLALKHGIRHYLEVNAPYVEERVMLQGNSFFLDRAHRVESWKLSLTDKIVVVSSALKEYFISRYGIEDEKILITPNAINKEDIIITPEAKEEIVEKYGLRSSRIIGFVGSIFEYHGVDLLMECFAALKDQYPNWKLFIVGGGLILNELRKMAVDIGCGDSIIFTGKVPYEQVYNYIDLMDITVLANSNWYGSPVKIFEYGAIGKPILAPNYVPIKDVMIDNEDGLLVNPKNKSEIIHDLKRLINEEGLRERVGKSFQTKILKKHTWLEMAKSILD